MGSTWGKCQSQDPRQRRYPTRPATFDLRRQAAGRWQDLVRLQHPEGVHPHLVLRLRGGGKKRKKKNYTTPKKIKHKHTKVKLATLRFYKVEENGKINRL